MEIKDYITIGISIISVIIAGIALYKSSQASSSALNIQHASVELEIRNSISSAQSEIRMFSVSFASLKVEYDAGTLDNNGLKVFEFNVKTLNSMIESMLNKYDDACGKYLDGKIDKNRFKKTYHREISNLVQNGEFKKYFDPVTTSYKAILVVYKEWFDLESA